MKRHPVVEMAKGLAQLHSPTYDMLQSLYGMRHIPIGIVRRSRLIHRYLSENSCRKIYIGAGSHSAEGWLMTDYRPQAASMIYQDVRRPFPFPTYSIDYYFLEHMISQVEYSEALRMLKEMFRTLRPGGRVRIATPDLQKIIALNNARPGSDEARYIVWSQALKQPLAPKVRAGVVINNLMSGYGQRFVYDETTLSDALELCGFGDIRRYEVGESDDPVLRGLEQHGDLIGHEFNRVETFVIEARRPE